MGMNTTLFKKYAELRATYKSVHLPIVRCYIYAPFFATRLVSFNWDFFTKYFEYHGSKWFVRAKLYLRLCCPIVHTGVCLGKKVQFFHPLKHSLVGKYGELIYTT